MIKKYNQGGVLFGGVSFSTVAGDVLMPLLGAGTAAELLAFTAKKKRERKGLEWVGLGFSAWF